MCVFKKPKIKTPKIPDSINAAEEVEPAEMRTFASEGAKRKTQKTGTQRLQIAVGGSKGGSGLGVAG